VTPQYTCRPANDDDFELLYRVYASTREEELAALAWPAEQKDAFLRMQFAAQDAHYRRYYDGATYEIVLVDGQPAGRLYLHRTAREIRIMDIALLPAFRRKGLGERMLRDIFSEADDDGKLVSIHVEHMNPARRLYERLGFQAVDEGEESPVYVRMDRTPAAPVAQLNTT
jgi:ribosomal protein S18 acetylase RimI-like enzyme